MFLNYYYEYPQVCLLILSIVSNYTWNATKTYPRVNSHGSEVCPICIFALDLIRDLHLSCLYGYREKIELSIEATIESL